MPHWTKLIEHIDEKIEMYVEHIESGKKLDRGHWEDIHFYCELVDKIHDAKETVTEHKDKHLMGHDNPKRSRGMSV